ncbi:MAG: hypothetical protein RMI56_02160 [Sulfolobales archaeon]|nr:Atg14 domain-containing protein [Sulfolobales archaeon]MDW8082581.1 hypothetical protein [Sulfolobales archaeon]
MLTREQLLRRLVAVAVFTIIVGVIALMIYPEIYFELQIALVILTVLTAVFGHRYPGLIPAFSIIFAVIYLYMTYALGDVRYILPYAEVALFSLILVFLIPLYLSITKLRELGDAIVVCYHLIVYMLSVTWARSIAASFSLFAGLSTLSSGITAVISVATYSILLVLTTYVGQFSVVELSELKAVPTEFLRMSRETLGYEVFTWYVVALTAYMLGFAFTRLIYRVLPPLGRRGTLRNTLHEVLKRLTVAIPIVSVTTFIFIEVETFSLVWTFALALVFVSAMSLIKSYQEIISEAYGYILDLRELVEVLRYKIAHLEEIANRLREDELESLKDLRELIKNANSVIQESAGVLSSIIPSYLKIAETYEKLSALNSKLNQKFESIARELWDLVKVSFSLSETLAKTHIISLFDEVDISRSTAAEWKTIYSSISNISEFLRLQCRAMERTLLVTIPSAYYELFGFRPTLRDVEKCSDIGIRAIRSHLNLATILLAGMENQIDRVLRTLEKLAVETNKLARLSEVYEVKNPYIVEFFRIYQDHFMQARSIINSDLLSKLSWIVDLKKATLPNIKFTVSKASSTRLGIEEVDRAIANSLGSLREPLARLEDPDVPLIDVVGDLDLILKVVFDTIGPLSAVGATTAYLHMFEKMSSLIEEYIREGLKQGLKFEEVFPLKNNMRSLWTLVYGSGEKSAV